MWCVIRGPDRATHLEWPLCEVTVPSVVSGRTGRYAGGTEATGWARTAGAVRRDDGPVPVALYATVKLPFPVRLVHVTDF